MINDFMKEAIEKVDSIEEFNILLKRWELSDAPKDIKEEGIRELKARRSIFFISLNSTPKAIYEDIQAGSADIDDIN